MIDIGLSLNLINKSGSWLSYGEERLGQGRENAKEFLKEHPETTLEIESKIRAMMQANQLPAAKSTVDAEQRDGRLKPHPGRASACGRVIMQAKNLDMQYK